MRTVFLYAVALSLGFWLDEALRYAYRRTLNAPITHGRFHA